MNYERFVRNFHKRFDHAESKTLRSPSNQERQFRIDRIREEADELIEAIEINSPMKVAREAADLIYVTIGCLLVYGIKLRPIFKAVHRANMTKIPMGRFVKPGKPKGWRSPDDEIRRHLHL